MRFLLPLLLLTVSSYAQYDTVLRYSKMDKSTVIYSSKGVYKSHTWDSLDFKGATFPINVKGEVLYMPAPISDTLIISEHKGDYQRDSILSYGFKGGAYGFYFKGTQNPNGSVYDYFNIHYPDKKAPNGDIHVVNIQLVILKKGPNYSN